MRNHESKEHAHENIECERCGKDFVSNVEYSEHIKREHSTVTEDINLWALDIIYIYKFEKHTKENDDVCHSETNENSVMN